MTTSHSKDGKICDAIVIGAGHNGLTAAAYLGRAGLSTLILERREIVGGCCVTEEVAPGCRASTTSYIASMLRPEVVSELRLRECGLRMIPCDPAIQVPFPDSQVVPWWSDRDRARQEFAKISTRDAERFVQVDDQLKRLARYLQPFFLPLERTFYTLVPSLEFAERCYDTAKFGDIPEELWVDCVVSSNADPSLAPAGKHILTCFVQYVPYKLREGNWDEKRELLGNRVLKKIAEYAPNVPSAVLARQVLTPLDLERTYGLTEGNIFHGDLRLEQLFFMRPVPGWSQYRTPIDGLYLCGAGAHPGGGVTGAPGRNAAHQALRDWKKGRFRKAA